MNQKKKHVIRLMLATFLTTMLVFQSSPQVSCLSQRAYKYRDLTLDLGGGLTTEAQLTYPADEEGPFPGVLLVPGSGAVDMNEYIPEGTATGEPVRPFLQIAKYLSERGFAVLRYNKRGVDLNLSDVNVGILLNLTYPILKNDAEKALKALMQQDEVDPGDITIIGHSEGSYVASLVVAEKSDVKNIVLMGMACHPRELGYWQTVELKKSYAEDVLDSNHDGLISIQEAFATLGSDTQVTISAENLIENSTGEWLWIPGIDQNGDGYFNISGELKPLLLQLYEYLMTAEYPGSKLIQSSYHVDSMMDTMGGITSNILILHGEDDIMTPITEALILEQVLTEAGHPDHALISYPGLSHYFYPSDGYSTAIGPIQETVLLDLVAWLKDPVRDIHILNTRLQNSIETIRGLEEKLNRKQSKIGELENQVEELQSEASRMGDDIAELESRNDELQEALNSSRNLLYMTVGVAVMAIIFGTFTVSRRLLS